MRLLKVGGHGEYSLTRPFLQDLPEYAILSHRWGGEDDEVTFDDLRQNHGQNKTGYSKIRFCGDQAEKDGLEYFWVDTCCIDKANHPETAEAINSMFRWYKNATKCYVFLKDVSTHKRTIDGNQEVWLSAFRKSEWFTRGWTLQELLAPTSVEFFSREGDLLGNKRTLEQIIHEITAIPVHVLRGAPLNQISVPDRMRWVQNRQTTRKEDEAYCLLGIFDVFMSPIYGEGDHAFVRLKDEIARSVRSQLDSVGQGVQISRSSECILEGRVTKASSINDQGPSLQDRRKVLLESLGFEQMDSRRSTIKSAYSTTCQWLLDHPVYLIWIDPIKIEQHNGFIWLNGKPGAGKSTLIKFAHAHAERYKPESEIIVSFFFNARGEELEKTTTGMYRALLYQLFDKIMSLQELLDDHDSGAPRQGQYPEWTLDKLCELLMAAMTRLGQRQLKCFIDALDECDEQQIQDMIIFFEELGQTALENGCKLYICFASRHYPTIDTRNGLNLTLEDELGHSQDMAKYIQNKLRAGKGKAIETIRKQIQEKANGVFMWAVLVVPILNKEFRRGRIFAVKKRLEEIPPELSNLFREILTKDNANVRDLLLCIQWVLFAQRPLKREEFYYAMVAGLDPDPENLTEWDRESIGVDEMNRFLTSSSKGLAEITRSKAPTVQFIHESVRDFLLKEKGLSQLWPELDQNLYSQSHNELKRCCQNYLTVDLSKFVAPDKTPLTASSKSAKDRRKLLMSKFPFLDYAKNHVLHHADEAATGISQTEFLENFNLHAWKNTHNLLEPYDVRQHAPDVTLVYILAENNCARLITGLHRENGWINVRGGRYKYPLFAALAKGHQGVVQALLSQVSGTAVAKLATLAKYGPEFSLRKGYTPLLWAIEQGHKNVVEALISLSDTNLHDHCGLADEKRSCLALAAENGHEAIVSLLLKTKKFDANTVTGTGRTPLSCAAEHGHRDVALLLIDNGADLEARSGLQRLTALSWAISGNHKTTVPPLLDKSANVEGTNMDQTKPIHLISKSSTVAVLQLLLDRGADIEATDSNGKRPLHHACQYSNEAVLQLLLDRGADIESTDSYGKRPLHYASQNGHETVLQLLLDRGADIEATDSIGWRPLHHASRNGHEAVLQLLLDRGADIKATDSIGWRPLHHASRNGHETVLQLLLDRGADIEATDSNGWRPLHHVSQNGHETVLQLLLDRGADIEATDSNGRRPLHHACQYGNEAVLQLLLDHGADIDAVDCLGRTALYFSVERQGLKMVQMLCRKGADLEAVTSDTKFTALLRAAKWRSSIVAEALMAAGANVKAQDAKLRTSLSWAAENGNLSTTRALLSYHANVDTADKYGNTPLLLAVIPIQAFYDVHWSTHPSKSSGQHTEPDTELQLRILDRISRKKLAMDRYGLIYTKATFGELMEVIQLLLSKSKSINAQGFEGKTALIRAAESGREELVQLLLEHGADVNITDEDGYTALDRAAQVKDLEVTELLVAKGATSRWLDE